MIPPASDDEGGFEPLEANPAPQWSKPEFRPEAPLGRPQKLKSLGPSPALAALILFVATTLLFLRGTQNEFVNYDDNVYVLENPLVNGGLSLGAIGQALTTQHSANWHPLTWFSHALDVELFGLDPAGHHLTSVLLHALTAVLFLRLMLLLFDDRWLAISAAVIWAWHPLRVESVSWVSERKDVLSGFLAMLTLISYVGWTYFPSAGRKRLIALVFALGLMAKPMLVSLPLVMLLLDAWPLGRLSKRNWSQRLKEKLPCFVIAALVMASTLLTQASEGAISAEAKLGLLTRIENAQLSLFVYFKQFFLPGRLSALYPHIANTARDPQLALLWPALLSLLCFTAIGLLAAFKRKSMPWLALGMLWFALMLLPVLGLIQVGYHAHADRYTYLPSMGLALIAASVFRQAQQRAPQVALGVLGALLLALGFKTYGQIGVWRDSVSLWENALAENPVNLVAHKNLALALRERDDLEGAIEHYALAHEMDTQDASLLNHIGEMQLERGDLGAALLAFERAQRIDARDWTYALNRASILLQLARPKDAALALDEAEALGCQDFLLPLLRGQLALAIDQGALAGIHFEAALARAKTLGEQLSSLDALGALQVAMQEFAGAIETYEQMLALDPTDVIAHYNLGNALDKAGQRAQARESFARALALDPGFQAAQDRISALNLGD